MNALIAHSKHNKHILPQATEISSDGAWLYRALTIRNMTVLSHS